MNATWKVSALGGVALLLGVPGLVRADLRSDHFFFFEGIHNLQQARTLLSADGPGVKPGSGTQAALTQIDAAIGEFRGACLMIDDRTMTPRWAVVPQESGGPSEHLRQALVLLHRGRMNINREEHDPLTDGPQHRSIRHIDEAVMALSAQPVGS